MKLYQFSCDTCGVEGPPTRASDAARVALAHRCGETCPACGWRKRGDGMRGLCGSCYHSDARYDYETKFWRADDLLGEYDLLRRDGYTVRQAAARLGVTFTALDKALCRAKQAGDPRAVRRAS